MRGLWAGVVVGVLFFGLVGCTSEYVDYDRSLEKVQQSGVLVVGMDPSYPPFETYDGNGQLAGFDVEMANALAQRMGVKASFAAVDVGGMVDALAAKKIDVGICSLSPVPEQGKVVLPTLPYFDAGQVMVVPSGVATITKLEDLKGHTIAVENGSIGAEEMAKQLKTLEGASLNKQMTSRDALEQLRIGKADVAVVDAVTALDLVKKESGLAIVGNPITNEPFVVLARSDAQSLLTEINLIISAWRQEGYFNQLSKKWF
jgi:ABC-type amino acid transport substrate-binding protein